MLRQLEGSRAVAETVAGCRPEVVAAYPISPQTHIVEGLSRLARDGGLAGCEYINVESEFAAMSVCIGASATGARRYTATSSQGLDPDDPMTIGAMVGPEAFFEVKYLMHHKQLEALSAIPRVGDEFAEAFGRPGASLVREYRTDGAETIVLALGSVLGTIEDVVDELRDEGVPIGALGVTCFRPWPIEAVREALQDARRVVVVEKAFAVGA